MLEYSIHLTFLREIDNHPKIDNIRMFGHSVEIKEGS